MLCFVQEREPSKKEVKNYEKNAALLVDPFVGIVFSVSFLCGMPCSSNPRPCSREYTKSQV